MEHDTHNTEEQATDRRIPATARLDPETFGFYQEWAQREDRSMSQVLRIALERYHQTQAPQAEAQQGA